MEGKIGLEGKNGWSITVSGYDELNEEQQDEFKQEVIELSREFVQEIHRRSQGKSEITTAVFAMDKPAPVNLLTELSEESSGISQKSPESAQR